MNWNWYSWKSLRQLFESRSLIHKDSILVSVRLWGKWRNVDVGNLLVNCPDQPHWEILHYQLPCMLWHLQIDLTFIWLQLMNMPQIRQLLFNCMTCYVIKVIPKIIDTYVSLICPLCGQLWYSELLVCGLLIQWQIHYTHDGTEYFWKIKSCNNEL